MQSASRYLILFPTLTVVSGAAYWLQTNEADWWACYRNLKGEWQPKFRFTWPEQFAISGVIGALIAAPLTVVVVLVGLAWRHLMRR
jgi:hypothetical protein